MFQDSEAAASETGDAGESYDDGDDSDMYMEPDGAESAHSDAVHESHVEAPAIHQEDSHHHVDEQPPPPSPHHMTIVAVRPVQTSIQVTSSESSESVKTEDKPEAEEKSLETDSQNFFPSFAELFGNHRLPFTEHQHQQQRYRPSRFLGYFQRDRPYAVAASSNKEPALLGSGNFGVIPGGTYYPEDKENDEYSIDETAYSPFYHGAGRGRSNYYKNPKPQPVRGGDFFANFRDFADITAPPKSSFSHLSVVYAAKNGSSAGRAPEQPRNIIETLRMLEEEEESGTAAVSTTTTEMPQKKLSQGKRKLMKMKKYHEDKARKSRMTVEPLLALS